jgi:hypothetical protein
LRRSSRLIRGVTLWHLLLVGVPTAIITSFVAGPLLRHAGPGAIALSAAFGTSAGVAAAYGLSALAKRIYLRRPALLWLPYLLAVVLMLAAPIVAGLAARY